MHRLGRTRTPGDSLDEAFFQDHKRPVRGRNRILPLGPVLLLWALVALLQHGELKVPGAGAFETLAGSVGPQDARLRAPITLGGDPSARRLRIAQDLLARNRPEEALHVLAPLRTKLADQPLLLRLLARAQRALGHREQAAELYVVLLQNRSDDIDALEFFLRYRYEDDDLEGALELGRELEALGALQGSSALLVSKMRAEQLARVVARRGRRFRP